MPPHTGRKLRDVWEVRYYDFAVYTERRRVEKIEYMHNNPVTAGFVLKPGTGDRAAFKHQWFGAPLRSRDLDGRRRR